MMAIVYLRKRSSWVETAFVTNPFTDLNLKVDKINTFKNILYNATHIRIVKCSYIYTTLQCQKKCSFQFSLFKALLDEFKT